MAPEHGAAVPLDVMWELTGGWYADRLDPAYEPAPAGHYQSLLSAAGLVDEFWQLV